MENKKTYVTRRIRAKIYGVYETISGVPELVKDGIEIEGKVNDSVRNEIAEKYGVKKILLVDTGKEQKINYKVPVEKFMEIAIKEVAEDLAE